MRKIQLAWLAPLAASALIAFPACTDDVELPDKPNVPDLSLAQLESAPESLDLAQQSYRLETYLWRDFMPISPEHGRGLSANVRLISPDEQRIPRGVKLAYLWVINGKQIWSTKLTATQPPADNMVEAFAAGGPKWDPGISVDVVVGVTVESSPLRLVRAPAQLIHRTD